MKVINLFGGPGVGKSKTACELFAKMKSLGYSVEIVHEYAKELTYGKDYVKLSDQLLILAEENHRLFRLRGEVDFVINDASFVTGLAHLEKDKFIPKDEYLNLVISLFNTYDNFNVFLERNSDFEYQTYGRGESLEEAIQKDRELDSLLKSHLIPSHKVMSGDEAVFKIINSIKDL